MQLIFSFLGKNIQFNKFRIKNIFNKKINYYKNY